MCLRVAIDMRRIFAALSLLYAALGSYYVLESSLEYPETIQALTVLAGLGSGACGLPSGLSLAEW